MREVRKVGKEGGKKAGKRTVNAVGRGGGSGGHGLKGSDKECQEREWLLMNL